VSKPTEKKNSNPSAKKIIATQPARNLRDYMGIYQHPFLGNISITGSDLQLDATFQCMYGSLQSLGENWFEFSAPCSLYPAFYGNITFYIQFDGNANGDIDSVVVPAIQSTVAAVIFTNEEWIPRAIGYSNIVSEANQGPPCYAKSE